MLAYVVLLTLQDNTAHCIPHTFDDLWKTMPYIRMYALFKNPLLMKSPPFGLLLSKPRCVRKLSNAGRGNGVYAIDEG